MFWHPVAIRTSFLGGFVRPYFSIMPAPRKDMPERIIGSPTFAANIISDHIMDRLMKEQTEWELERDELRQENADLTEKINQLEVALGQLLKECKYLQSELVKKVTQEAAPQGA